ncbi:MAG: hypothetical protein EOP07_04110 [Proteobacteria bacterium]|nr:MAG: hypothetical protein EOP07_04110 [Pseudomonadota bacterium]
MKKLLVSLVSLFLFSNIALAVSHDEQVDLDLEAAALSQVIQGNVETLRDRSFLGLDLDMLNPLSFLTKLKEQVDGIKETLLSSFDENGNGKIDQGAEFENFKVGVKAIAMLFADSNQNGKIDPQDIVALSKLALTKVQEQTLVTVCPAVYSQVELTGPFLPLRPVLSRMNDICIAQGIEAK